MQTPEPGAEPKDDDRDGTKPRVLASAAAAFDAALDLPEATAGAAPEAAPSPPSPPTLYPPLPDALVQQLRQMAKLVEQIARRVLEIETAHRTTVARVVELETACSVQRCTLQGITQVLEGHKRAIGALSGRHNEQEHAIVAVRAELEGHQEELAALHALVTQDFLETAVDSLTP